MIIHMFAMLYCSLLGPSVSMVDGSEQGWTKLKPGSFCEKGRGVLSAASHVRNVPYDPNLEVAQGMGK